MICFVDKGESDNIDRPLFQRETTQLSDDFERHTREESELTNENMDHSRLDQAATRIQASYRGYRTRRELQSIQSNEQHPSSTSRHVFDEHDHSAERSRIVYFIVFLLILFL